MGRSEGAVPGPEETTSGRAMGAVLHGEGTIAPGHDERGAGGRFVLMYVRWCGYSTCVTHMVPRQLAP